ncbi:MAG: M20/M25/M40 family metallo-hydrolase [Candidatus Omnitrophica bacterium]|nr:M20/M25/M40 family metallo-hydrolase [Candidatus Omnitrophota bacterium]
MIAHVSRERLLADLRALEGERHPSLSPDRLAEAQAYVQEHLLAAGLAVHLHEFSYMGTTFVNVIARAPSVRDDQPRLLIGAHLDTVPGTPGADDNASGLVVLLEAARVLTAQAPSIPVEFVAFNLEELGMIGSAQYAAHLKRRGVELSGMLSLESVGFTEARGLQRYPPLLSRFYPSVGNFIGLAANRRSKPLLDALARAMRAIPGLPVETILLPANGWLIPESRLSDHAPFWDAGYPALLVTDTAFLRNPHYHQPTDTLDTLDLAFLERVCQGVVNFVAEQRSGGLPLGFG